MRPKRPEALLRAHHAWEPNSDKLEFQWRARLLQSLWREDQGLAPGSYRDKLRGARLAMPEAQHSLANYLNPRIREVVRAEVDDPMRAQGKLYGRPRIYDNLLSSQPLCFNLFAELSLDLELATHVFSSLSKGRVAQVTAIDFEFSPGRGDPRYTGDRSAFDVYLRYQTPQGTAGFTGIEVKYHEGLDDPEADHRSRYDEVAEAMGCFLPERLSSLRRRPLQQVWRDHLLVGAHQQVDDFADAFFVFLYAADNSACAKAVKDYAGCLQSSESFVPWTLEAVIAALDAHSQADWIRAFQRRYLDWPRIDRCSQGGMSGEGTPTPPAAP